MLGEPSFELCSGSGMTAHGALLKRLGADQSVHYFHPAYATVSLAVGFKADRVTRAAMVSTTNPNGPGLSDIEAFWRAEDSGRPVPWRVAKLESR